jgi:hypothetical protein
MKWRKDRFTHNKRPNLQRKPHFVCSEQQLVSVQLSDRDWLMLRRSMGCPARSLD